MSLSSNNSVFDQAMQTIDTKMMEEAYEDADNFRQRLERAVTEFSDDTYRTLTARPMIDTFAQAMDWAPLSWATVRKTGEEFLQGDTFINHPGQELLSAIARRNPSRDFGKPRVRYDQGQSSGNIRIDSAGRPQYRAGSGKRGFAPRSALRGMHFDLVVELFPHLDGMTGDDAILKMTTGHNTLKLSVFESGRRGKGGSAFGSQPARPFIKPFLQWYRTTALRHHLNQTVLTKGA